MRRYDRFCPRLLLDLFIEFPVKGCVRIRMGIEPGVPELFFVHGSHIEAWCKFSASVFSKTFESLIEALKASGATCDRIGNWESIAKVGKQTEQSIMSELLDPELHDQGGYIVGILKMHRGLGREEHAAHAARRFEFAASKPMDKHRVRRFPPVVSVPPLFVDRDTFGEPTRHPVVGQIQCHDVTKLVPQDRFPIVFDIQCRWGVGRDHIAKAHAQESFASWEPKGSYSEIPLLGKELHDDGFLKLHLVLVDERFACLLQELDDLGPVDLRFGCIHTDDQAGGLDRLVLGELTSEDLKVVARHMERIGLASQRDHLPTLLFFS